MDPLDPSRGTPAGEAPDDVDRLYARLTHVSLPRDFAAGVLLAVRGYRLGRRQVGWLAAELVAVAALAVLAFVTGQALVGGGTLALLGAVLADAEVLSAFPLDTTVSLLEGVPWLELLLLAAAVAAVMSCTRQLGRALADAPAHAGRGAG